MTKQEKNEKSKKSKKKFYKVLSFILIVFTVLACSILFYFNIIPYKFLIPGVIVLGIVVLFIAVKLNRRTCLFTKIVCSLFSFIFITLESIGIFYAFGTIDFLNNIFDTGLRSEVYSIYVLNDSKYKELTDLKNKDVATYKSDMATLSKAKEKLQKKVDFKDVVNDSLYDAVDSVVSKKSEALFVSDSLIEIYSEDHDNIKELKKIGTITIYTKHKSSFKSVNVSNKPFVVYLSGVDSSGSINTVNRSDVNILAFVNPDAGKVLLVSTPRDYYVTLATKKAKDKLTHAGLYGIDESAKTLANLYNTEVNYYIRVNFTSFVKLIDKLGGVTINVAAPDYSYNDGIYCGSKTICEQNSKRAFGSSMVYIKSGTQTLNGEQALAYARNRHQYNGGDNTRQLHQQQIIEGIIAKASSKTILTKYTSILESLSKRILTNVEQKTITQLVNKQLDDNTKWSIDKYTATGKSSYASTYSMGRTELFVTLPDTESVNEAKLKIKAIMES